MKAVAGAKFRGGVVNIQTGNMNGVLLVIRTRLNVVEVLDTEANRNMPSNSRKEQMGRSAY